MLISICIPTYNGEKYLRQCIESVLGQSFADFEIIFSDDCSTDDTLEIIKAYQLKDSRIGLFVNEKNIGLVGNWNRCLELAKGEWIKFMFQDDLMADNCMEGFRSAISNDTKLIVSEREFYFENDITPFIKSLYDRLLCLYHLKPGKSVQYFSRKDICRYSSKFVPANFIGEPSSVMFHHSCVDTLGQFNKDMTQICDLEYWLRISINHGLVYIPEKLVTFRVHGSSATQKNNSRRFFTSVYLDKLILMYMMLNDPLYINFRELNNPIHLLKFKNHYYYTIYHARKFIRKNDKDGTLAVNLLAVSKKFGGMRLNLPMLCFYPIVDVSIRAVKKILWLMKRKKMA